MSKASWDILQCPLAKRCRARWQKLEPVQGDPAIRFSAACERSVYRCQTDEDLSQHSALGRWNALSALASAAGFAFASASPAPGNRFRPVEMALSQGINGIPPDGFT